MFDIEQQEIRLQGKTEKILRYEVWFMTPFGLIDNLEEAIERVKRIDMVVELTIRPVAIAISETLFEVVSR